MNRRAVVAGLAVTVALAAAAGGLWQVLGAGETGWGEIRSGRTPVSPTDPLEVLAVTLCGGALNGEVHRPIRPCETQWFSSGLHPRMDGAVVMLCSGHTLMGGATEGAARASAMVSPAEREDACGDAASMSAMLRPFATLLAQERTAAGP